MNITANIHSLKNADIPTVTVTIVSRYSHDNIIAEYNGKLYSAIYNVFDGMYYVNDIYGAINKARKRMED